MLISAASSRSGSDFEQMLTWKRPQKNFQHQNTFFMTWKKISSDSNENSQSCEHLRTLGKCSVSAKSDLEPFDIAIIFYYGSKSKESRTKFPPVVLLIFSMLSGGLGRPGALTSVTQLLGGTWMYFERKYKNSFVGVLPREGTSGVPDLVWEHGSGT